MSDRPYYDPDTFNPGYLVIYKPGIGLVNPKNGVPLTSSIHPALNSTKTGQYNPGANIGVKAMNNHELTKTLDKNYVYDLELVEYFDINNLSQLFKNLFWNFFKNYCKVLLLQPLEIARLVLQVGKFDLHTIHDHDKLGGKQHDKKGGKRLLNHGGEPSTPSDSDSDDEINYFQSNSEFSKVNSNTLSNSNNSISTTEPASMISSKNIKPPTKLKRLIKRKHKIHPISKHTIDIISSIIAKDGPNGLFRGINAQFIHQTLSHTIEAWITGFLSPFLGIPDPFFLDLTHLTEPTKSLCLSVLACVLTGIILMPLDLIKVKLMLTQFNRPYKDDNDIDHTKDNDTEPVQSTDQELYKENESSTRSIRESLRNYPLQLLIKPPILITCLTILHQFSTSIFRKSAPYLLFIRFNIDSYSSPRLYTIFNLLLLIMEFFIKLPVENLLRKEQVRFLLTPKSLREDEKRVVTIDNPDANLIIEFNDGYNNEKNNENKLNNLWQGLLNLGLFNGWRVGVLNIIGFWGYKIMKSEGITPEERF